ncbi:chromate transporter [Halopseudomonas pachastrellae]|nr:chromate transporter [Halopseudomonas pachastrellae]
MPVSAGAIWLKLILIGGGAMDAPHGLLTVIFGWQGTLTQMGWFFTKAALLTFGGAYAVLPYVYQGAVGHYGWLSPTQMIDGLALGETTPGPLIMVVTFVGFIGSYIHPMFGTDHPFLAGAVAAVLVTWFTSALVPVHPCRRSAGESTHNELKFTAPLTGITAAVVGVILNLAFSSLPRALAQRLWGRIRVGLRTYRRGRRYCPVLLQARCDPGAG